MARKKQDSSLPRSLRSSDLQLFNAIIRSVKEKIKYIESAFRGPKRSRRRKKRTPKKGAKNAAPKTS